MAVDRSGNARQILSSCSTLLLGLGLIATTGSWPHTANVLALNYLDNFPDPLPCAGLAARRSCLLTHRQRRWLWNP